MSYEFRYVDGDQYQPTLGVRYEKGYSLDVIRAVMAKL